MAELVIGDKKVALDEDGFMKESDQWNAEVGLALAKAERVNELTEAHWKVIHYLRGYYSDHAAIPKIRILCRKTGFSITEIYDLFPSGPGKGACKIAGLPKPPTCV